MELISLWKKKGYLSKEKASIAVGAFHSHRIEDSLSPRIYGNHQGGYRVRCSSCAENIVSAFSIAVEQWRAGGERRVLCPHCSYTQPLEESTFAPPVAFSRAVLNLIDVQEARFAQEAHEDMEKILGSHRIIYRRIG